MPASPRVRGVEVTRGSVNPARSPDSNIRFGESTPRMQREKCRIQKSVQKCLTQGRRCHPPLTARHYLRNEQVGVRVKRRGHTGVTPVAPRRCPCEVPMWIRE